MYYRDSIHTRSPLDLNIPHRREQLQLFLWHWCAHFRSAGHHIYCVSNDGDMWSLVCCTTTGPWISFEENNVLGHDIESFCIFKTEVCPHFASTKKSSMNTGWNISFEIKRSQNVFWVYCASFFFINFKLYTQVHIKCLGDIDSYELFPMSIFKSLWAKYKCVKKNLKLFIYENAIVITAPSTVWDIFFEDRTNVCIRSRESETTS